MADYLSYRLEDFLLFSPTVFYRQFELYNAGIWPAHILTLCLALVLLASLLKQNTTWFRTGLALTGVCWVWTAWGYLETWYATINWIASYFAVAFAAQGALMLFAALNQRWHLAPGPAAIVQWMAGGLILMAIVGLPLAGLLVGRPVAQIEWFGLAPNPTVVITLGLLVGFQTNRFWPFFVIPLLWCVISGLTRWTLAAPDFWVMPACGLVAMLTALAFRNGMLAKRRNHS